MKKLSAILCALLIACLAVTACAEDVPSSTLYKPAVSETFKALVAGKTFEARVSRNEVYGQDEDARWTINIVVCEETRFEAADIENLKVNDILAFAPDNAIMVMEKTADEFGFSIKDQERTDTIPPVRKTTICSIRTSAPSRSRWTRISASWTGVIRRTWKSR